MINKELKKELLKTLDISSSALSQQCKALKKRVPITTEDAVYVIAQRNNIILDKYLNNETVERVRALYQQVSQATQQIASRKSESTKTVLARQRVIKIGKDLTFDDPILSSEKINEAIEMARLYPLIYVLENSAREFIDRIMTAHYGKNWWDSQVPEHLKIKKDVKKRMSEDEKNSWHQRRGARPIDHLDLIDLPALMEEIDIEKIVVPNIIPSLKWFRQLIEEVYKSRCVVCHMNPLDKNNIQAVTVWFKYWEKQITAKQHLIPK